VEDFRLRATLAGMLEYNEKKRFTWVQAITVFNPKMLP
jgi:hypothetical protein